MEPEPGQWFIRMVEADSRDSRDRESGLGEKFIALNAYMREKRRYKSLILEIKERTLLHCCGH